VSDCFVIPRTIKDINMKNEENQRLRRVNQCFLGFTTDPDSNIQLVTNCCGELMGAACALYNRLQDGMLYTLAQWNAPPDYNPVDRPDGHICHDVIKSGGKAVFVVPNLHQTGYAKTDPNVSAYCLKTYIGAPVNSKNRCVGSLCVVYQIDYSPDEEEKKLLQILAVALGVEEERREEALALRSAKDELEIRVAERTADLARVNEQLRIDIAERKRVEESLLEYNDKLHAITDTTSDAIIMMDDDGKISFWNHAAEKIFGFNTAEALGKDLHPFLAPGKYNESYQEGIRHFRRTGTGNVVGKVVEFEAIRKDGLEFPIELSLSAFQIKEKWNAAGILRDITERKQVERKLIQTNEELKIRSEELLQAQEELVRKEKLAVLGRLAGCVGHELRNPLGVINNAVYYLKMVMTDADESVKEYLNIIMHEIGNSQRIINDLLDFARAKAPQIQPVTARKLIHETLGKCVVPENVKPHIDVPDFLPALKVDPLQIGQVLHHLFTNALQAMPEGGSLNIAARPAQSSRFKVRDSKEENIERGVLNVNPGNDFIEISVEDTGVGISPENMGKLFQPLFTTKPRGIGLGLVVCKNLTEAGGGWIAVESRPAGGTTFAVTLPAAEV
jgi:PAS domain S-box-containing protein